MDIINFNGHSITVFDGDITTLPPVGFVIYGTFRKHMLAYICDGKIITLNSTPFPNLNLAVNALQIALKDDPLWTR
ncbi:hypothetical protein QQ39_06735 [Pragia fontium]|nr:hypothetical protein QQ39_06735 [Pragia fontium]